MPRVRGDDELMEILGTMGGAHVGEEKPGIEKKDPDQRTERHRDTSPSATDTVDFVCVPETGWNGSIWNPHVLYPAVARGGHAVASGGNSGASAVKRVSPHEEVARQQAVSVVFSRFQILCKELGIRGKNEMFERWQFNRKLKEGRGGDPILPAGAFSDPGLDAELQELGVQKAQSRNLCCELGRASKSALKTLKKQLRLASGLSKGVVAKRVDESTYVLQLGKNRLRLNSAHYTKMKELFRRARADRTATAGAAVRYADWTGEFHDCLFACLMRYEALQGGGFQASMGGDAFDVLLTRFGVTMECFASPFNCRYASYCSAFADTDAPFGSLGSFFDFRPTEGSFEANPPFVRDVILKMANHMEHLLKATPKPLTFVVIIPAWEDAAGWVKLRNSSFLSRHVRLDQKDHGYCEGKQHLRRNRYRLASFHTSVFFLQTAAAAQGSPVTLQACDELQRAFAPKQEGNGGGGGGNIHAGSDSREAGVAALAAGSAPLLGPGFGLSTGSEGVAAVNHAAEIGDKVADDCVLPSTSLGVVAVGTEVVAKEGGVTDGEIRYKASKKEKGGGGAEETRKRGKGRRRQGEGLGGIAVGVASTPGAVGAKTGAGGGDEEDERLPEASSAKKRPALGEKKRKVIAPETIEGRNGRPQAKRPKKGKPIRTEGKKDKKGKKGKGHAA